MSPCIRSLTSTTLHEDAHPHATNIAPTLQVALEDTLLAQIKQGYETDEFCIKLRTNLFSMKGNRVREADGLLYRDDHLIIPAVPRLRETLYHLAHDSLGHFGTEKSYKAL